MVRRNQFINKIRELEYCYKGQQKRTYLYRKKGTTLYISVPMKDLLEDIYVISTLRQAGLKNSEIQDFLRSAKS